MVGYVLYIESTFMLYGHGIHGIVGITLKPSTLKKWAYSMHSFRPQSHLLYGEDKAAVRPLTLQKRAAAAEKLR